MYSVFGLEEPKYVDKIIFKPLLVWKGCHGIDFLSRSKIYLREEFIISAQEEEWNAIELEKTIFHESAHHLHYKFHRKRFNSEFVKN